MSVPKHMMAAQMAPEQLTPRTAHSPDGVNTDLGTTGPSDGSRVARVIDTLIFDIDDCM